LKTYSIGLYVIELIGIEKSWHKVPVLQQVSFRTAPGETLVLLGPSGAGKSSLLRMMNLLDTPDAGVLRIADSEFSFPSSLSTAEFNRQAQACAARWAWCSSSTICGPSHRDGEPD
jgi:arginine transport system ATP-binding protein